MKKLLFGFSVLFICIGFVGCSSSGDSGSSTNTTNIYDYDLWEYVGTNSILNANLDRYTLDDNNNTTATELNYKTISRIGGTNIKSGDEIGTYNDYNYYWYKPYERDDNYISRGLLSASYGLLNRLLEVFDRPNLLLQPSFKPLMKRY